MMFAEEFSLRSNESLEFELEGPGRQHYMVDNLNKNYSWDLTEAELLLNFSGPVTRVIIRMQIYGLYPLLLIVGPLCNAIAIYVLLGLMRRSAIRVPLVALCVADSGVLLSGLAYEFSRYALDVDFRSRYDILCHLQTGLTTFFELSAVWIIATIALFRFLAAIFPFRARQILTQKKAIGTLVILLLVTATLSGLYGYFLVKIHETTVEEVVRVRECREFGKTRRAVLYAFDFLFRFTLPIAIMIVCNAGVLISVWRSHKASRHHHHHSSHHHQHRTRRFGGGGQRESTTSLVNAEARGSVMTISSIVSDAEQQHANGGPVAETNFGPNESSTTITQRSRKISNGAIGNHFTAARANGVVKSEPSSPEPLLQHKFSTLRKQQTSPKEPINVNDTFAQSRGSNSNVRRRIPTYNFAARRPSSQLPPILERRRSSLQSEYANEDTDVLATPLSGGTFGAVNEEQRPPDSPSSRQIRRKVRSVPSNLSNSNDAAATPATSPQSDSRRASQWSLDSSASTAATGGATTIGRATGSPEAAPRLQQSTRRRSSLLAMLSGIVARSASVLKVERSNARTINTMLIVGGVAFLVLYAPLYVFQLVDLGANIWSKASEDVVDYVHLLLLHQSLYTFIYVYHAADFFLYLFSGTEFRRHLMSMCVPRHRRALKLLAAQRHLGHVSSASRASQASLTSTLSLSLPQSPSPPIAARFISRRGDASAQSQPTANGSIANGYRFQTSNESLTPIQVAASAPPVAAAGERIGSERCSSLADTATDTASGEERTATATGTNREARGGSGSRAHEELELSAIGIARETRY